MISLICPAFVRIRLLYICVLKKSLTLELIVFLFFAVVLIQVVYFIVFISAFRRKTTHATTAAPPVSILVCAHDEEENLKELIPLLQQQNYPEFEIIIINDRSNDSTFDLLLAEGKKDSRVRMVNVERVPPHVNSKKYSLTLGIKAAKNDWILLTDADCRPDGPNWISTMSQAFHEKNQFVIGFSPFLRMPGFLNLFIRFEAIITALQYLGYGMMNKPYMGVGRNLAYRKSLFLAEKGFNNFMNVTGGDDDLFVNQHATRSNTDIVVGKDATIHTMAETTWGSFLKQKTRHLSVGKYYKFKNRFYLGTFMGTWMLSWWLLVPALLVALLIPTMIWFVASAMLLRVILLMIALYVLLKRLDHKFELWMVPFLDFLFSIYYLTTGLITLGSKKVRWKN